MTVVAVSRIDAERIPGLGDIALATSLLGVAILSGFFIDAARPDTIEPSTPWHWALIASPSILVAFRRLDPIVVTIVATIAQAGIWISDLPAVLLPIIVILYAAASDAGRRGVEVAIGASFVLTIVTAVGVRIADDVSLYQLPLIMLSCGTAIALGVNAANQRRLAQELAIGIAESRLKSEHERAQAVADERSHIARELHDIIGHTLSVIAVRAEAADRVSKEQPEVANDAVSDIAGAARTALGETRRVLAGLRRSSTLELAPPPDLGATRRLVTDLAKAGVNANLTERGCDDHDPPAVVAGGAHRIVQESLTNAIKHGGPSVSVEVYLTCSQTDLEIRVDNTIERSGRAAGSDITGGGLAGMAERAEILGGAFRAGPAGDRFRVEATIPIGPMVSGTDAP